MNAKALSIPPNPNPRIHIPPNWIFCGGTVLLSSSLFVSPFHDRQNGPPLMVGWLVRGTFLDGIVSLPPVPLKFVVLSGVASVAGLVKGSH